MAGGKQITFKLDTVAEANIISKAVIDKQFASKAPLKKTTSRRTTCSGEQLIPAS